MAHEPPVGRVIRQRYAAPGTFRHIAALAAKQHPAAAPAVQKKNALFAPSEVFLQLRLERCPNQAGVSGADLLPEICNHHLGKAAVVVSPAQQRVVVDSPAPPARRSPPPGWQSPAPAWHDPGRRGTWRCPGRGSGGVFRLVAPSCSSSSTMSPRFFSRANTADRVPRTTGLHPRRMRFHWSYRSVIRKPLWSMATRSPK